jgi:hypothetical protein
MLLSINSLTKIVATYEVPDIETPDDSVFGSLKFLIQIGKKPTGKFAPRVLRKDRFRIDPAYGKPRSGLIKKATTELLVPDDSVEWDEIECDSEDQALHQAVDRLKAMFSAS